MSELENVKPVAFYRADWKGDMMFRMNNTIDVRKNESDFTKGWIKPLYDEIPEQPQLTIPKSIADEIDCVVNPIGQIVLKSGILSDFTVEAINWIYKNNENGYIAIAYANPLTRDLVKVVADD